jgi:8-oxo-dGTP diphosphatase
MEHDKNLRPKVGLGILIFKDGKVLLGKRKHKDGLGHGEYAGTGGHLEYMESIEECAKRETLEEAGIQIENIRFLCLVNVKEYAPKHYVDIGLVADWKQGEPKVMEPDKLEAWDWYDVDHLPSPLFGMVPKYFETYKNNNNHFWDS